MKIFYLAIILLACLLENCRAWKETQIHKGDKNDAIKNAILDYLHSNVPNKYDSIFSIRVVDISNEVIGVVISVEKNKIAVIKDNGKDFSYKLFPTKYFEQNGKLFYWIDSTQKTPVDLINKLEKLNRIDTVIIGRLYPKRFADDAQKAMNYYFCKNNLKKYKKIYTSIAMGWYTPPAINCADNVSN